MASFLSRRVLLVLFFALLILSSDAAHKKKKKPKKPTKVVNLPVKLPVSPPVNPPVKPPVNPPVTPPAKPPVSPPVTPPAKPPVSPPAKPPVSPPVTPPAKPPVSPPVTPPAKPPVSPPAKPPVTPPVTPPAKPPVSPPVSPPAKPPVTPPAKPPVSPPVTPPAKPPVSPPVSGGLNLKFYDGTCSVYSGIVKKHVAAAMQSDPTIAAGLLRMHFHDCWSRGCDASVLLNSVDGTTTPEKLAGPNLSLRGFQVIDNIKSELETACKGIVSCADILTSAARDAVVLAGGPSWDVPLGRKDGRISNAAEVLLPSPFSDVDTLITQFKQKGLTILDLVALSAAHTIGFGSCSIFQNRLTNDPTMNATLARELTQTCTSSDRASNDPVTQNVFDNQYYKNLQQGKGLFSSDQGLFFHVQTRPIVNSLAANEVAFAAQFSASMFNLITLPAFQANVGGIRSVCSIPQ